GLDAVQLDRLQDLPAEALVPTRRIRHWKSRHQPRVDVREVREEQAADRPVDDRDPAVQVARAEDDVAVLDGLEELRQMRRIVGEVRVHLEEVLVAALEAPAEALEVGGAEPELASPVEDVDARVF